MSRKACSHTHARRAARAQRGKGLFYCGVGILVFFMGPNNTTWHWGVNNIAALVLALVGALHTFHVIRDDSAARVGPALTAQMAPSDGLDFARPLPQTGLGGSEADAQQQWAAMREDEQKL